tara:strand:- start:508 stop:1098 length:591 start_codon:yes stop_codon:yes gene_type:complete
MRITKRQLRRVIKEEKAKLSEYGGRPYDPTIPGDMQRQQDMITEPYMTDDDMLIDDYEHWVKENGHITPAASSVMATYFLERGLEDDHDNHEMLGQAFGVDHDDIMGDINRQRREKAAMMGESKMKVTKRQLKRIIKEERAKLNEALDGPGSLEGAAASASSIAGGLRKGLLTPESAASRIIRLSCRFVIFINVPS